MPNSNIYKKLSAIQAELNAPKKHYNDFGKYHYRKAEDILEALKPFLKAQGCAVLCEDELLFIEGRFYIKATATLVDVEDGSHISTTAYAREEEKKSGMDASQVTGSSSTYARKYALNGLFCIDDTADADTTNVGDGKRQQKDGTQPTGTARTEQRSVTRRKKNDLSTIDPAVYNAWVAGAAEGKNTKTGVPCRDGFIATFHPTEAQMADFDTAVLNYRLENNIPAQQ